MSLLSFLQRSSKAERKAKRKAKRKAEHRIDGRGRSSGKRKKSKRGGRGERTARSRSVSMGCVFFLSFYYVDVSRLRWPAVE